MTLTELQFRAHRVNVQNGWWEDRDAMIESHPSALPAVVLCCIALQHSELSEAVEAIRKHVPLTWSDHTQPDTAVREMAGCVVRIMDLCERMGWDLEKAVTAEIDRNETRGHRHGGRAA